MRKLNSSRQRRRGSGIARSSKSRRENRQRQLGVVYELLEPRAMLSASPIGVDTVVNTTVSGAQERPSIAMDNSGNFVAVWENEYAPGVFGQRYNADGSKEGAEFQVNSVSADANASPWVAISPGGEFFVVVYEGLTNDRDIYYRVFDTSASGTPSALTSDTRVNTFTDNKQENPTVAMNSAGNFIVAWDSPRDTVFGNRGVYAQRFAIEPGSPPSWEADLSEFRINSDIARTQLFPDVALKEDGQAIFSWTDADVTLSLVVTDADMEARIFDDNNDPLLIGGLPMGDLPVNTITNGLQWLGSNDVDAEGNFVVTWQSVLNDDDPATNGIYARRFEADGDPINNDDEFLVSDPEMNPSPESLNTYAEIVWASPLIDMNSDGEFVITWGGLRGDVGGDTEISGRHYDSDAVAQGDEFQVNFLDKRERTAVVAVAETGDFTIAWTSDAGPADKDIYLRQYNLAPEATMSGPDEVVPWQARTFTFGASDSLPDEAAGFTFLIDWDGDSIADQSLTGATSTQHTFTETGAVTLHVVAVDQHGAASAEFSYPIDVVVAQKQNNSGGVVNLVFGGTAGDDDVVFEELSPGEIRISGTLDGESYDETFSGVNTTLFAFGGDGADILDMSAVTSIEGDLRGGGGNDTLQGGAGNDTLRGEAGDDTFRFARDSATATLGTDTVTESTSTNDALDSLDFTDFLEPVTVNLASSSAVSHADVTVQLTNTEGLEGVVGSNQGDTLTGNTRNNRLDGGDGADTIGGGSGADTLLGGGGDDSLSGGTGDDTYDYQRSSSTASLGADTVTESTSPNDAHDALDFSAFLEAISVDISSGAALSHADLAITLTNATGLENVVGSAQGDTITGNSRDNVLTGGQGDDTLIGGTGDDTYSFARTSPTTALGSDTVNESTSPNDAHDKLDFGSFGEAVTVDLSNSTAVSHTDHTVILSNVLGLEDIQGTGHHDNLTGNDRENNINGGAGNDVISGGLSNDVLHGDWDGAEGNDTIYGGAGNDVILGDADEGGSDSIFGDAGDDVIDAGGDDDWVDGGDDNDTINGGDGAEGSNDRYLFGGAGNDVIRGNVGDDTLDGGAGDDTLEGDGGNDTYQFNRSSATDVLGTDTVTESISTNDALDTLSFSGFLESVVVNLGSSTALTHADLTVQLTNVDGLEGAVGSSEDDTLTGNTRDNQLSGSLGNDALLGGDTTSGSTGDDTLLGGEGDDTLDGGNGTDRVVQTVDADQSIDASNATGEGTDSIANIEEAYLTGGASANTLTSFGFGGVAWLSGGAGNDTIMGGSGHDTLEGGTGDDTMWGQFGGTPNDDTYWFARPAGEDLGHDDIIETTSTNSTGDLLDFSLFGEGITVDLSAGNLSVNMPGKLELDLNTNSPAGPSGVVIEHVIGSITNDTIKGNSRNNVLAGGGGNDTYVFARANATDPLGSDTIDESTTSNSGRDTLDFSDFLEGITIDISAGAALSHADLTLTLTNPTGVEWVIGTAAADSITGNSRANVLRGGLGSDTLIGLAAADQLWGEDGADSLSAGDGDDLLVADSLNYGANLKAALDAIFVEWTSAHSYFDRIQNIMGTGTAPLSASHRLVPGATVVDDEDIDNLTGGNDDDWFLADILVADDADGDTDAEDGDDVISDLEAGEVQTDSDTT